MTDEKKPSLTPVKTDRVDERLKKDLTAGGRESRATQDRGSDTNALASNAERRRMFRNEWIQESLPSPPPIPGFHVCWLSTTNGYDPIHKRTRMGYSPVQIDEVPGFENYKVKAGEHAGFVACNEMLLYKIPEEIYQEIMAELHHYAPQDEADKIRVQAENIQGARDSNGKRLGQVEGDGIMSLDEAKPVPIFQ
tara:strand:+ start:8482 stop:9063 length:582 start_codon:yes stop_codon:yes gene_type:complete